MSLLLAPIQAHGIVHVPEIQKEHILISNFIFFIVYQVTYNVAIRASCMIFVVHIAPKGGILIFIWAGSKNCYAHTEWHLIFPDNDVDMSLEYPYAQHLLFWTCSSLIMAMQKVPKIRFYGGFKLELWNGWHLYVNEGTDSKRWSLHREEVAEWAN